MVPWPPGQDARSECPEALLGFDAHRRGQRRIQSKGLTGYGHGHGHGSGALWGAWQPGIGHRLMVFEDHGTWVGKQQATQPVASGGGLRILSVAAETKRDKVRYNTSMDNVKQSRV